MRRKDREVTDREELLSIIEKCDVCRLVFADGDYPYIVPLNFGMRMEDGRPVLYFHGADQGYKYEMIEKNKKAVFEMDCGHRLVTRESNKSCTMEYECVIGRGKIEMVPEEEKFDALSVLMKHYHREDFDYNQKIIPHTNVFKLTVEQMTGKKRKVKAE